jgi:hypothetical protein
LLNCRTSDLDVATICGQRSSCFGEPVQVRPDSEQNAVPDEPADDGVADAESSGVG